ncbi:MAG: FHA domain-containing protein [Myxococcota bacterium]
MDDDFPPGSLSSTRTSASHKLNLQVRRFWLEHGDAKMCLEPRAYLVGRSSNCELMIGDARVSRRHARLLVRADSVVIEDMQSANGVFVNGVRILRSETLRDGDQFQIGSASFVLKSELLPCRNPASETPATTPMGGTLSELSARLSADETEAPTVEAHSVDLLGTLADKSLALGRTEEAERLLTAALEELLRRVRAGRIADVPPRILTKAAYYAVLLAEATERGSWIDYAVSLFAALRQPLPASIVDQLYAAVRKAQNVNRAAFREYLEMLRELPNVSPADRFIIQRLAGLERQISHQ